MQAPSSVTTGFASKAYAVIAGKYGDQVGAHIEWFSL
jgi:hypothetical protein